MSWFEWLKIFQLKPRFLFGVCALGLIILFSPDFVLQIFGIKLFHDSFRGLIGLITLIALVFWIIQLIPSFSSWRRTNKARARILESLDSLSIEERLLLMYCLHRNQQTISLEVIHRDATALTSKGIFVMASGVNDQLAWPFNVPNWLWKEIKANPALVFKGLDPASAAIQNRFQQLTNHIRRHDF